MATSKRADAVGRCVMSRPDEPMGRYAVVLDDEGNEWLRMPSGMWHEQHTGTRAEEYPEYRISHYEGVAAVRVLSEGVV